MLSRRGSKFLRRKTKVRNFPTVENPFKNLKTTTSRAHSSPLVITNPASLFKVQAALEILRAKRTLPFCQKRHPKSKVYNGSPKRLSRIWIFPTKLKTLSLNIVISMKIKYRKKPTKEKSNRSLKLSRKEPR